MKKIIMMTAVIGGFSILAACKKDHTCSCTVTITGSVNSTTTWDTTLTDMKKSDAETTCSGWNESWDAWGSSYSQECELK